LPPIQPLVTLGIPTESSLERNAADNASRQAFDCVLEMTYAESIEYFSAFDIHQNAAGGSPARISSSVGADSGRMSLREVPF